MQPQPKGVGNTSVSDRLSSLTPEQRTKLRQNFFAKKLTGDALVAEALRQCGVKRVFGISGTPVERIFSECWARQIRPIGTRHQQTAVVMAAAGNFIAGRIESVAVVSAGPAVTNSVTGVLVARDNGWPLIVLGGRRALHEEGIGYFQELDAVPIFQSITKWASKVERASDITSAIIHAYEVASAGRPGPVYLDLPEDVLHQQAERSPLLTPAIRPLHEADTWSLTECAGLLHEAKRPLLILGEGIRWSFDISDLTSLVGQFDLPFITAPLARGFLPDDHPLCANEVRHWIQSQADVVLMAGAWFDWRFRFGGELSPNAQVIHVDIDESVLGKNLKHALPIHADSGRFLTQLRRVGRPAKRDSWREHVYTALDNKRRDRSDWLAKDSRPMQAQQFFKAVRDCLPRDAIVVLDANLSLSIGQAILSATSPCSWFDPGWNGCMGAGIPMGMAAKLASPERSVIVICGDFAFGVSAMDLETAVRHRIPITVLVANNNGINAGMKQATLFPREYDELFSRFPPGLRYDRIMDAFGGHAEFVTECGEIRPALERAAAAGVASCINVEINPEMPHPGSW